MIELDNLDINNVKKISGLVMISLHSLGLGSTWIAEIFRLQQHQVYWKHNSLNYMTISNKRPSAKADTRKRVQHKLPPEVSHYLFLYDTIGMKVAPGRERYLFPQSDNFNLEVGENKYFYNSFAKLMNLSPKCSSLIMHHLYTSICKYVFHQIQI